MYVISNNGIFNSNSVAGFRVEWPQGGFYNQQYRLIACCSACNKDGLLGYTLKFYDSLEAANAELEEIINGIKDNAVCVDLR